MLAAGGDLSPPRLLEAYRQGIFPWYEPGQPILWWSPDPRMILYPSDFKLSKSLKKTLKKPWTYTIDKAFNEVIHACATCNERTNKTWITQEMKSAYFKLYELGFAHSVEVWNEDQLIGGLYGLSIGAVFFGESMFHIKPDASKLALYFLCQTLKNWHYDFIDCQLPTEHLKSLGCIAISRKRFLQQLQKSIQKPSKKT